MKLIGIISAAALSLAIAACGTSEVPQVTANPDVPEVPSWEAPDHYAFTLESSCGERWLLGSFRVSVESGETVGVEGLDDQARDALGYEQAGESVETITSLLDEAASARERGADVVEVEMSDDGHPSRIDIDRSVDAEDDEACYVISDYSSDGSSAGDGVAAPTTGAAVERAAPDSADVEELVVGLNDVGYRIFDAASQDSAEDLAVSPLSIGVAFGMADAGASGATSDALSELFSYPVQGEDRWAAFNALEQAVTAEDGDGPVVRLANRQFPDASFETVEGYDELLGRWFGTGIEPLPLRTDSEASRERINGWVAERTEDLIPDLLPAGFLNPNSVMVLVNALYLEADWARPFGKYPTEDATFTRLDDTTVTVPMMHELELAGPAVATDEYAATELPYAGDELSMLVIVPEAGRFEEVEARLSTGLADEVDATATSGVVELYLPRFESSTNLDLRGVLQDQLGANDLFGVPGFEGIAPGITLENAVHATDIAVDEAGTVAAAATALGFNESGPPEPEVTVRADRPFLYLIRHQPTGAVLFIGRVMDPAA